MYFDISNHIYAKNCQQISMHKIGFPCAHTDRTGSELCISRRQITRHQIQDQSAFSTAWIHNGFRILQLFYQLFWLFKDTTLWWMSSYFVRLLRKHGLPQKLLLQFYTAVIEAVLRTSITVWFGAASKQDKSRLQRSVRTAGRIIGASLLSVQDLWSCRKERGWVTL